MRQMSQRPWIGSGNLSLQGNEPLSPRSTQLNPDAPILPVIYLDKCNGCGRCTAVCPAHALAVGKGKVRLLHTNCDYCGECEAACPNGAIACPFDVVWEIETTPTGSQ